MNQLIEPDLFVFIGEGMETINANQIPDDLQPIIDLFVKDNDGQPLSQIKIDFGRLFLNGKDEQELMLRMVGDYFKVARIMFRHKRQGNMKALEQLLIGLCKKCPDKKGIVIESVLTEEMRNYCLKNGYKPFHNNFYDFVKEKEGATYE